MSVRRGGSSGDGNARALGLAQVGQAAGIPLSASAGLPCACTPGGPTRCGDVLCLGSTLTVVSHTTTAGSSAASLADTSNQIQSPGSEASDYSPEQQHPRFGSRLHNDGGKELTLLQDAHRLNQDRDAEAELKVANLKLVETVKSLQMQLAEDRAGTTDLQAVQAVVEEQRKTIQELRSRVTGSGVDDSPCSVPIEPLYQQLDAAVARLNQPLQQRMPPEETPDYTAGRYNLSSRAPLLAPSPPAAAGKPPVPAHSAQPQHAGGEFARMTSLLENLEEKLLPALQDLAKFKEELQALAQRPPVEIVKEIAVEKIVHVDREVPVERVVEKEVGDQT